MTLAEKLEEPVDLERYRKRIKTGQDLIDEGVIPKTAAQHLGIITYERLKAVKRAVEAGLDETLLGSWIPLLREKTDNTTTPYELAPGVVADDKLGHYIQFKKEWKGKVKGADNSQLDLDIAQGETGKVRKLDTASGRVEIFTDTKHDNRNVFTFTLKTASDLLDVSTLGQMNPQDRGELVYRQTLEDFFPTTRLDTRRAHRAVLAMMMGKDNMVFYGPPGSGKTNIAKDIISIMSQQEAIFTIEGCRSQCNPYSLFDPAFEAQVPLCPECIIKYSPDYKETGLFDFKAPKDVRVTVGRFTRGKGIAKSAGKSSMNLSHLAGFKLPITNRKANERVDEFGIEGFSYGPLPKSNNGALRFEEIDKLRPQVLEGFLEAMEEGIVESEQVRFPLPCMNVFVGTANDPTVLPDPFIDRVFLLAIRYPEELDTNYKITRVAYHNEFKPANKYPIGDTHKKKPGVLRDIPMPVFLEKAVDAMYMKLRDEYNGPGKKDILGSNRSKIDALDVARAQLLMDQVFYSNTPKIATTDYAIKGMQFAVCARIATGTKQGDSDARNGVNTWISNNFEAAVKSEESKFWCEFQKRLAIGMTQVPELEKNYIAEIAQYKEKPDSAIGAFGSVKYAHDSPTDAKAQVARVEHPFMDYLVSEQPRIRNFVGGPFNELISYFLKSQETATASCKV
jgi:hypothetical protein